MIQRDSAKRLSAEELDILYLGNGTIETADPINDYIIKQNNPEQSLAVLNRNQQKIENEKQALTSITPFTMGSITKNVAPTFYRETLETAMRSMEAVESAYTIVYNEMSKKIAKIYTYINPNTYKINIDDMILDLQVKNLDPVETMRFMQDFTLFLNNFGQSSQATALFKQATAPIFTNIISVMSQTPTQDRIAFEKAFDALIENQRQQEEIQKSVMQQQLNMQSNQETQE